MTAEKVRKTLYIPLWLVNILDKEGERAGGPGQVTSAALYAFLNSSPADKIEMLRNFQDRELNEAYEIPSEGSEKEEQDKADFNRGRKIARRAIDRAKAKKEIP